VIELSFAGRSAPQVVCLGAHCDDIEIGCGGTLARIAQTHRGAHFHCWVFSGDANRQAETRACLAQLLGPDRVSLHLFDHRDGYFPAHWAQIKQQLAELSLSVSPDLVFTHSRDDSHQDHRLLSELTWNHFRRHTVVEYEIVKYEGDLGHKNLYVALSGAQMALKLDALAAAFVSQHDKPWFTRSTFEAIARLRGIECHAPSGYAEAFSGKKMLLEI
jgi:LmbE family N-acetylglucosaminyl deacetylase